VVDAPGAQRRLEDVYRAWLAENALHGAWIVP
jgi:hypothetical protein